MSAPDGSAYDRHDLRIGLRMRWHLESGGNLMRRTTTSPAFVWSPMAFALWMPLEMRDCPTGQGKADEVVSPVVDGIDRLRSNRSKRRARAGLTKRCPQQVSSLRLRINLSSVVLKRVPGAKLPMLSKCDERSSGICAGKSIVRLERV
jgi:hypothetical protein